MQISVTLPGELGPHEIAVWRSMQRQTRSLANPFLCPEFAVAVDKFRPDVRVAVLTDGPAIVGFFPFERRRFGVGVPIGAGLNDCEGLIHASAVEWDPRELLKACKLAVWQFDHLAEGQQPFESYAVAVAPSPVIDLTDGFVAYQKRLSQKSPQFCRDIARKARKLEREVGELRFVGDSRDTTLLRTLLRWKSDQYHRSGRVDNFGRQWIVDLIDYLFSTHGDGFDGLLSVLSAGESPVAAHFGLRYGHMLAHWFPAYDTSFGRHSPGLIQHLRMAEETAALGIDLIDMGKGSGRYKQTLKSHDLLVAQGMATRGPLVAGPHRLRRSLSSWARLQVKQHPSLFHAAEKVLQRYNRIS